MRFPVVCLPYSWRDKVYSIDSPPFDAGPWSSFHTADQMVEMWKIVTLHLCWSDWSAAIYSSADDPKKRLWVWDQGASKPLFFRGVPFQKSEDSSDEPTSTALNTPARVLLALVGILETWPFQPVDRWWLFPFSGQTWFQQKSKKMAGNIASHMWFIYYVCVFKIPKYNISIIQYIYI